MNAPSYRRLVLYALLGWAVILWGSLLVGSLLAQEPALRIPDAWQRFIELLVWRGM